MARTAQQIYQEVLDRLTGAIVSFDPETIDRHMALPHLVVSLTARHVLSTREHLHETFATFGHSLRSLELSNYRRVAHECEFVSEGVIHGHHTNHFEKDGVPVIQSYSSMATMELQGDDWKVTEVQSAIENDKWPMLVPQVGIEVDDGTFGPNQRLGILQDLMDRISDAFVHGDADSWLDCTRLPFTMVSRDGPEVFETDQDIRDDFARYTHEIRSQGVTDIIRKALHTQMVGSDIMIATYRTYILRRAEQVVPSWQASATLHLKDGKWRVGTILRNIGHDNWSAATAGDIENITKSTPISGERK